MKKYFNNVQVVTEDGEKPLSDLSIKKLVLFFYPRDNTSGCTLESQEFTELLPQFKKNGATVVGISRDTVKSHIKFIEKFALKMPLIADPEEEICNAFSVIKEKNMYGKKVFGIERSTFILDENFKIVQEWRKVKAEGHAQEVLDWVKENK
ncbi:MAG: peroxiredoxin [Bdellovibrionia bacterium]